MNYCEYSLRVANWLSKSDATVFATKLIKNSTGYNNQIK
jgi:hypothetical protein